MALLRHSGIYFLARILSGAAGFAIIATYTRLLDSHSFGELALAIAGVGFFGLLVVEGPMLAMLRHLPADARAARATTLWGLILPAVVVCAVAIVVFLSAAPERWRLQLALCGVLLIATLLHQFQLSTAQGSLQPGRYALLGTTLAALIAVTVNWRGWWIDRKFYDPVLARRMLRLFDRLTPAPFAIDSTATVFFIGRKAETPLKPKDMIAYYRGAGRS